MDRFSSGLNAAGHVDPTLAFFPVSLPRAYSLSRYVAFSLNAGWNRVTLFVILRQILRPSPMTL